MKSRPMSYVAAGLWSAGSTAGLAAATMVGVGAAGLAVNWIILLAMLPPGGAPSTGARMLIFGVVFPFALFLSAQPFAVARGVSRFYRRHRDEVLSVIAGALEREVGAEPDNAADRWLGAVESLRAHVERYPRAVRALLKLALRRLPVDEIESALRTGSGPPPLRIAGAIADHLEAELAGGASTRWLLVVALANVLAYGVVLAIA